jgi:hypothetical protein
MLSFLNFNMVLMIPYKSRNVNPLQAYIYIPTCSLDTVSPFKVPQLGCADSFQSTTLLTILNIYSLLFCLFLPCPHFCMNPQ